MAASYVRKKDPVTVRGPWFAMPIDFLRSRACAELSPRALKMLLDLCSQLGPNARRNGDLSAAPTLMIPRGWTSKATQDAVIRELLDAGLLAKTRQGGRNRCSLYAVTLWPMDCDFAKLDHGPGCYATTDWHRGDKWRTDPPSMEQPAAWSKARKAASPSPATGEHRAAPPPPRGKVRRVA